MMRIGAAVWCCSAAGTPPIRPGRLLHGHCQRLTTDDKGQQLNWGGNKRGMTYEEIYGAQVGPSWSSCCIEEPVRDPCCGVVLKK